MANNPVVRWQIISPAYKELTNFYTSLFKWEANTDNLLNYTMLDTGSERGIHGGVWPAPPEASSFVQLFVEVDDCEAYVSQAVALGAKVLIPPQALPDGDTIAVLKDPSGMSFALLKPATV